MSAAVAATASIPTPLTTAISPAVTSPPPIPQLKTLRNPDLKPFNSNFNGWESRVRKSETLLKPCAETGAEQTNYHRAMTFVARVFNFLPLSEYFLFAAGEEKPEFTQKDALPGTKHPSLLSNWASWYRVYRFSGFPAEVLRSSQNPKLPSPKPSALNLNPEP